ncbi:DUF1788 domain-containing protein [Myxosarcina sp. GI1]|uniref:DUF1788 domain-containing protein n=1 Tax=Myxosarcina sp. GI1 TaxID=1541065 RepID=UPI00056D161B|nr:DUF1788 domain-containing protein [Myxosarcina sp. GI1]
MLKDLATEPLKRRFRHLETVISSDRFLKKQGLGNEVPFFICPYKPQESIEMERLRKSLCNKLAKQGVSVLEINLYDLSIELLQQRGIWEKVFDREKAVSKDQLKELLQGVLDPEKYLIPAIADKMSNAEFQVMFLCGVGEVFPYIRSHNILNNLQSTAKERPTVLFFPGDYRYSLESGASLDLFERLRDDKYYRAFNIFHYEV